MSSPEHKQKIWEMISKIGTGMLVSQDDEEMRGRPMHLVQDAYDGTLWFFTKIPSAKVEEVQQDRHVCLTFSDPKEGVYVSLSGRAKVTQDKSLINKYWNAYTDAWFPNGKESPECAMLEVKINSGEHWDNDTSKLGFLYEVTKAKVSATTPDLGENEKFGSTDA